MPDPRRSNRSKASQPQSTLQHSNTASSNSSNKADRNARTIQRQDSHTTSVTPRSSPSNTPPSEPETRQTRQKRREQGPQDGEDSKDADNAVEDNVEDEDATRCICGEPEYPGVPIPVADWAKSQAPKDNPKGSSLANRDPLADEPGSFFVQCDDCKVWQHAGCVGIMSEESCPENYYCEECRRNLHKVMTNAEGQRYSRYLPLYDDSISTAKSRKTSNSKDQNGRGSRNAGDKHESASAAKRRSTMNSRATWEEEESFRRAVEASKTDGSTVGAPSRKAKRWREESEGSETGPKRRKTSPKSASPAEAQANSEAGDSDDAAGAKGRTNGLSRKSRGNNPPEPKEKDVRDRDKEKERERVEAANKRKGRAEKRHVEDPEPVEEQPRNNGHARPPSRSVRGQTANKASPVAEASATSTAPVKKSATRRTATRRVGRNQHTRDKDGNEENNKESPRGSNSRDSDDLANGKPSKPRYMHPTRTSLNDLKKRAAGILEYIGRTQVEMAGERSPSSENGAGAGKKLTAPNGTSKLSHEVTGEDGVSNDGGTANGIRAEGVDLEEFKKMSALEMMDYLSKEIVHWQQAHGRYGEKQDK